MQIRFRVLRLPGRSPRWSLHLCSVGSHSGLQNIMFASPDVGGIKRARAFAKFFDAELAVCDKYRKEANKIESMRLIGDVEGKTWSWWMTWRDTAWHDLQGTLYWKKKGANSVRAVCTHPVLSGKAYENIDFSVLEEIAVTDTIPWRRRVRRLKCWPFLTCLRKQSGRFTTMSRSVHLLLNCNF